MSYLRLLIYKILDALWLFVGRLAMGVKKPRTCSLSDVDEIVIYRADRLGDAVISLPFLERFVLYSRAHGFSGTVRIVASSYNRSLLEPLSSLENVVVETVSTDAMERYDRSIGRILATFFVSVRTLFPRLFKGERSRIAFVDLVDSVSEMALPQFGEYRDAYFFSANRGPFSVFFDDVIPERFAGSSTDNLVGSYVRAFSRFFALDAAEFSEFANAWTDAFYPGNTKASGDLLVFVGVKEIRNFPSGTWRKFIQSLASAFPERRIVVSDMRNNALIAEFETMEWSGNVSLVRNGFSHSELQAFAARHAIVIGIDGGDINMMRPFTNSLTIYTFGNYRVWGPYPMGKTGERTLLENGWHLESWDVRADRFAAMAYKKSFWLPSFQTRMDPAIVADFDVEWTVAFLREKLPE